MKVRERRHFVTDDETSYLFKEYEEIRDSYYTSFINCWEYKTWEEK